MNRWTVGFWDVVDLSLRWIGKSAAWLVTRKSANHDEGAGYALIGGAVLFTILGGLVGLGLSDHSRNIVAVEGAVLGCLLGACVGVFFGSFVEAVDDTINDVLRSLNSK